MGRTNDAIMPTSASEVADLQVRGEDVKRSASLVVQCQSLYEKESINCDSEIYSGEPYKTLGY